MAKLILNQGLQFEGDLLYGINGPPAKLQTMAVDDATGALAAGNTKLNDRAGYTQLVAKAFDTTPTRSAQTVTCITTFSTSEANFTIRAVTLHNTVAGSTTATSTGLWGGIDGQTFGKTSDFALAITLQVLFSSV
ncbi:MAG: hypothetical protein ABR562_03700 [Thermoplasmatota archaeon]